jgi:hypothetical protein
LLLLGVAGFLAYDAVTSARVMLNSIKQARSYMDNGIESVVVGDTAGAPPQLHAATAEASRALSASNHPSMRLLSLLPVVGANIRATRAVATAIADSAAAGLTLEDAARTLGWGNILIPGARSIGNVDLTKIQAATPKIDLVASQLQTALVQLRAAGGGHLLGPVATGYRDLSIGLGRRAALASDMKAVFHLLPTLLGGSGPNRYLVAVQSLAIPRATGGMITSVGVLTADHGRLLMGPLTPASPSMATANSSADVPSDIQAMLKAARGQGLGKLQGVLLTDSAGLSDMLWMTGPASPTGSPDPLTMDAAISTLERQLYLGTDAAAAAIAQAGADTRVLRSFLDHRPSMEAFAIGMAQALSERHLYLWMSDRGSNDLLSQLGATGRFQPASFTVVLSSTGDNRAGYYLQPTASSNVILDAGGGAAISTAVRVANGAPKGPASLLLGQGVPAGTWSGDATVYLPARRVVDSSQVAYGRFEVKPGGAATLQVDYHQTGAASRVGSTWTYRLVILPQPAISPMPVHISIKIPDGMTIASKANRLTDVNGTLVYEGDPAAVLTLWVSYR